MSGMSRRSLLTTTAGAAAGLAVAGCGAGKKSGADRTGQPSGASGAHAPAKTVTLIGDGSTAHTGEQPNQPAVHRLEPGQTPRSS